MIGSLGTALIQAFPALVVTPQEVNSTLPVIREKGTHARINTALRNMEDLPSAVPAAMRLRGDKGRMVGLTQEVNLSNPVPVSYMARAEAMGPNGLIVRGARSTSPDKAKALAVAKVAKALRIARQAQADLITMAVRAERRRAILAAHEGALAEVRSARTSVNGWGEALSKASSGLSKAKAFAGRYSKVMGLKVLAAGAAGCKVGKEIMTLLKGHARAFALGTASLAKAEEVLATALAGLATVRALMIQA